MSEREKIADIFKTMGQPSTTYVQRENGKLERELEGALNEAGQLCLITGPSKTGKTTLYRQVLNKRDEIPLIVQCDKDKTCKSIWASALESIDFERVTSRSPSVKSGSSVETEVSSKISWAWLANLAGRFKVTTSNDASESELRSRILAEPGPDLLMPVLKNTIMYLL